MSITSHNVDLVTDVICFTILILFLLGVILRIFFKSNIIEAFPNIAVSLGIFGTFVGIFIGLYNFDVHNIDKSIPGMLAGLKTAFITSIVGIFASVMMRLFYEGKQDFEERRIKYNDPIPVLNEILVEINSIKTASEQTRDAIIKCFKSDEEYSLVSQVKLIRQEIIDARREVNKAFAEFAEKLTEVSTKSLVDALHKVIGEFNVLLNELVGETFKDLSSAMVNINIWQQNYKEHIDSLENKVSELAKNTESIFDKLSNLTANLGEIENSLGQISISIENISVDGADLAKAVEHLSNQNRTLSESIEQIRQVGQEAKSVIPEITSNINNLTSKLSESTETFSNNLENTTQKFVEINTNTINSLQNNLLESRNVLKESVKEFSEHLEMDLDKSLDSLASSLASLSEKFVKDYTPLTERLKNILEIAERSHAN